MRRLYISKWSPNASRIAHRIDESQRRGSFGRRPWYRIGYPGVDDPVLSKDKDHEKEGKVTRPEGISSHEDDEADYRNRYGIHEEPEPVVDAIGILTSD